MYLNKSIEAFHEIDQMPWTKLIREINSFLQAIINHSHLHRGDQNVGDVIHNYLQSPEGSNIKVEYIDYEEVPQGGSNSMKVGKYKYYLNSPEQQLPMFIHQTPKSKFIQRSFHSTPKRMKSSPHQSNFDETANSSRSSPISTILSKQFLFADSGFKFNARKDTPQMVMPIDNVRV